MENQQSKMEKHPSQKAHKIFVLTQVLLRTMAFVATLAATLVMATNKQSQNIYGFHLVAQYSYSPAFRFFVGANAIACAYSVLSMPPVVFHISKFSSSYLFLFLLDMMMMVLVMAACSAATAIGYVGKNGDTYTGWAPICDHVAKFCDRGGASIVSSFVAFVLFFILSVSSANKPRPTT